MIPGYYRITVRRALTCPRCRATVPAQAVAWWRAAQTTTERYLCERCYLQLAQARLVGQASVHEQAERWAAEVER